MEKLQSMEQFDKLKNQGENNVHVFRRLVPRL